ncbi:MAG: HNH endonuclease signature motif containing protein [Verrucomicrobia bacterium]|nr:HNH endonuclease signature motif containing protein [Verrucomicrobiota bacterium]
MDAATRVLVRQRAGDCCDYCGLPQGAETFFKFHIEHIVARQHGGGDDAENLALACHHCNLHKGTNLTTVDAQTGALVELFHPRTMRWTEHFEHRDAWIEGRTPVGRGTTALLRMNAPDRRRLRG